MAVVIAALPLAIVMVLMCFDMWKSSSRMKWHSRQCKLAGRTKSLTPTAGQPRIPCRSAPSPQHGRRSLLWAHSKMLICKPFMYPNPICPAVVYSTARREQEDSLSVVLTPPACRAARGLLDWTQAELAARSGVSRGTIRDYEGNRHTAHRSTEAVLRRALEQGGVIFEEIDENRIGVSQADEADPKAST